VELHFKNEESIFLTAKYPRAAGHIEIHKGLVSHALTLAGKLRAGTLGIGELYSFLAHDLIANHMLSADREFFQYLEDS